MFSNRTLRIAFAMRSHWTGARESLLNEQCVAKIREMNASPDNSLDPELWEMIRIYHAEFGLGKASPPSGVGQFSKGPIAAIYAVVQEIIDNPDILAPPAQPDPAPAPAPAAEPKEEPRVEEPAVEKQEEPKDEKPAEAPAPAPAPAKTQAKKPAARKTTRRTARRTTAKRGK